MPTDDRAPSDLLRTRADWGELDPRWAGIRDEWIDVRGHPAHVLRADGPVDGTPHLLAHGLGGSATNWLEVIPGLAATGPVLAPDLPGFGRTAPPRPGAPRIPDNARFVWSLARELGWDRVVLHGNSMGGLISLLVAADAPDLVERMVLVAPGLPAPIRALHRTPKMALASFAAFAVPGLGGRVLRRRYRRHTAEQLYSMTLELVHADPGRIRPALRDVGIEIVELGRTLDWRLPSFVTAAESLVSLYVGRTRLQEASERVACPTLVVWGDADRLVGRHVVDDVVAGRPNWRGAVVPDCGHVPMLERPDRYLELVAGQKAGTTV